MSNAAVTSDLHQSFDIHLDFAPQITLNLVILVDVFSKAGDILIRQFMDAGVRIHTGILEDILCSGQPNAVDIGQGNLDSLIAG
jgi:hypothetical protein